MQKERRENLARGRVAAGDCGISILRGLDLFFKSCSFLETPVWHVMDNSVTVYSPRSMYSTICLAISPLVHIGIPKLASGVPSIYSAGMEGEIFPRGSHTASFPNKERRCEWCPPRDLWVSVGKVLRQSGRP